VIYFILSLVLHSAREESFMNTITLLKVLLTPAAGWPDIVKARSSTVKILLMLVIPSMLFPPAMLQHAGEYYQSLISIPAPLFFILEAITFVVVIYQIKNISNTYGVNIGYYEAFLLASVSIVPFCMSFLMLGFPGIGFGLIPLLIVGALCYSGFIFYKGFRTFSATQEAIYSVHIVYTVVSAAGSWLVLLAILIALK
jgi:hypothetical protein